MFSDLIHQIDENLGNILGYIVAALSAIAYTQAKEWWVKRQSLSNLRHSLSDGAKLSNHLAELRALSDCDRLCLAQFHNGDHFASGRSVQKITITHCVCRAGVSFPLGPAGATLQNLPATWLMTDLEKLFNEGTARLHQSQETFVRKLMIQNGNVVSIACLIPGTGTKEGYGFLIFDWLEEKNLTEQDMKDLLDNAVKLSAYL